MMTAIRFIFSERAAAAAPETRFRELRDFELYYCFSAADGHVLVADEAT